MQLKTKTEPVERVLDILPDRIKAEITQLCRGRRDGLSTIGEIRLRAGGRASVRLGSRGMPLFCSVTSDEISDIVSHICGGAIYAFRDKISAGYLPFCQGVRVGIGGSARYERDTFVGVEDISSLVFRIPSGNCDVSCELDEAFSQANIGMLIYSPPGGGKTTALRSLAGTLGGGPNPRRVCVVDEREEFVSSDYLGYEVDILKGYSKRQGLEIAKRTMSPDVIIIDEIGCDDAASIADTVRSGVPIIATAHAKSFDEIISKSSMKPLFDMGAFDLFVGISENGGSHFLTVNRYE